MICSTRCLRPPVQQSAEVLALDIRNLDLTNRCASADDRATVSG
jgi:hypothetical protein